MEREIMENKIQESLKNIVIPEHIIVAILGDLISLWKKSGIDVLQKHATAIEEKFYNNIDQRKVIQQIVIEASAVSNLILTLAKDYPFKDEVSALYPTKQDKDLNFLKKEITSRAVTMNSSVAQISKLPKPLISQRLGDYLKI